MSSFGSDRASVARARPTVIRVLLVDDHALVRRGLRALFEEEHDIEVAGEAGTVQEALALLDEKPVDVVVLDVRLPGMSGLEAIPSIRERHPDAAILVLSVHSEDQLAVRALRSGAAGYLDKAASPQAIVEGVRKVARGGRSVSAVVAEALARHVHSNSSGFAALSDREVAVLRLLASGRRVKEIATLLSISPKTVSTYRSRILEKLGIGSNAELALYAAAHGLVTKSAP